MKLRTKILLLLIPLIILPMLAMGWIAYSELNEKSKQTAFGDRPDRDSAGIARLPGTDHRPGRR